MDITKKEKALLRQLAHEAWKTELDAEMEKLFEDFGRWADKGMSAFDLSDKIHEFHNGVSRELYVSYSNPDLPIADCRFQRGGERCAVRGRAGRDAAAKTCASD